MLFIIAAVANDLQDKVRERGLDSLRAVKDGNVRKRTLRPNHVRAQFHDVVITKDKAEDEPRPYLWCPCTTRLEPILRKTPNKHKPHRLAHACVRCAPTEKAFAFFEISPADFSFLGKGCFLSGRCRF